MKNKIKALAALLAALVLMTLLPAGSKMTVKAAEPATYSVKYIGGTYNEWRYQPLAAFDDSKGHGKLSEMLLSLKDGDSVVVYPGDPASNYELKLGSVKLKNLTVHQGTTAFVFAGGIDECYVLANAYTSINGNVTAAYIYGSATCTFNNDVLDMYLYEPNNGTSSISCIGTVGYFRCEDSATGTYKFGFYNLKDTSIMQNGSFNAPDWKYSAQPSDAYTQAKNGTASAPAAGTAAGTTTTPAGNDYDDVPKTGETSVILPLLCASAIFLTGGFLLKNRGFRK